MSTDRLVLASRLDRSDYSEPCLYGALIVILGYIGDNDPKRQGQRHSPNASDGGLTNEVQEMDGMARLAFGFLISQYSPGSSFSLYISYNLNVFGWLCKVGFPLTSHHQRHIISGDPSSREFSPYPTESNQQNTLSQPFPTNTRTQDLLISNDVKPRIPPSSPPIHPSRCPPK